MKRPYVQIILGTLNGERWLVQQLESIESQFGVDWTLLISDDGSTDRTVDIANWFVKRHGSRKVQLRFGPRKGVAANYLHLLNATDAQADFVALADQDDIWFPDRLIRATQKLSDHVRRPSLYASRTWIKPNVGNLMISRRPPREVSFRNALAQNILPGNTIVLNKPAVQLVKKTEPLTTNVPFHDWWLYLLMTGCGGKIILDDTPTLIYRQHSGNLVGANTGARALLKRAGQVFSGSYRSWLLMNISALRNISKHLDCHALALLSEAEKGLRKSDTIPQLHLRPYHGSMLGNLAYRISCEMVRFSNHSKQN